jgi:hypothetical protein
MIVWKYCSDCGRQLRTRRSIRCQPCSVRYRAKLQNHDWQPTELEVLQAYCKTRETLTELTREIAETRQTAVALRSKLLARHNAQSIQNKIHYLQDRGCLSRMEGAVCFVKVEPLKC